MKWIAWTVDRFLNWWAPISIVAHYDTYTPSRFPAPRPNPKFNDLPTRQVLTPNATDEDIELWSDLAYMRDLTNDLYRCGTPKHIPADWSMDLAAAIKTLKDMKI